MRKIMQFWFFPFVLLTATDSALCDSTSSNRLAWVRLFTDDLILWLENENRIEELCPGSMGELQQQRCKHTQLKSKQILIAVYASPSNNSRKIGTITIVATPGKGLGASFMESTGSEAAIFEPDLFDIDWGYGPYFHQTVIEEREGWALIPQNPLPAPGWISVVSDGSDFLQVEPGIYTLDGESLFVTKVNDSSIEAREEVPSDMACTEEVTSVVQIPPTKLFSQDQLFDGDGHLKLRLKYMRGC